MLNSAQEISDMLESSLLQGKTISQLSVLESTDVAFTIEVDTEQSFDAWELMKSLLPQTGRYPVILDTQTSPIEEPLTAHSGIAPKTLIARIQEVDIQTFLDQQELKYGHFDDVEADLAHALASDLSDRPDESEIQELIDNQTIQSTIDLEAWLFKWELYQLRTRQPQNELSCENAEKTPS